MDCYGCVDFMYIVGVCGVIVDGGLMVMSVVCHCVLVMVSMLSVMLAFVFVVLLAIGDVMVTVGGCAVVICV